MADRLKQGLVSLTEHRPRGLFLCPRSTSRFLTLSGAGGALSNTSSMPPLMTNTFICSALYSALRQISSCRHYLIADATKTLSFLFFLLFVVVVVVVFIYQTGGSFFACEDFGKMFDH